MTNNEDKAIWSAAKQWWIAKEATFPAAERIRWEDLAPHERDEARQMYLEESN